MAEYLQRLEKNIKESENEMRSGDSKRVTQIMKFYFSLYTFHIDNALVNLYMTCE